MPGRSWSSDTVLTATCPQVLAAGGQLVGRPEGPSWAGGHPQPGAGNPSSRPENRSRQAEQFLPWHLPHGVRHF